MSGAGLAILCGGGALPLTAARAARARGREPLLVGLSGSASAEIEAFDHIWLKLGEFGKLTKFLRERGVDELSMLGAVSRPEFADIKLDWGALKHAGKVAGLFKGGDDGLLKGLARIFESEGFRFVGVADFAPELLAPAGDIAGRAALEWLEDIAFGAKLLSALSPFDVGQGVVVARGRVLAVEAAEGTDEMLARVADLRGRRRLRLKGPAGVFVKAPKIGQDLRFDLPTIGPATVEAAARAELAGIAVAAGATLILERDAFVAAAVRANLFVVGFLT